HGCGAAMGSGPPFGWPITRTIPSAHLRLGHCRQAQQIGTGQGELGAGSIRPAAHQAEPVTPSFQQEKFL
ncbi:MAG: hypothetical protein AB7F35_16310, partial [Acetobacteraceae bacterium]